MGLRAVTLPKKPPFDADMERGVTLRIDTGNILATTALAGALAREHVPAWQSAPAHLQYLRLIAGSDRLSRPPAPTAGSAEAGDGVSSPEASLFWAIITFDEIGRLARSQRFMKERWP